jgi:hypothetical protein
MKAPASEAESTALVMHPFSNRSVGSSASPYGSIAPATPFMFFLVVIALFASPATALDFQVDFRSSTYQTQIGATFSDLLAQHQSEALIQSNITTGLENISTAVHGGGITSNYSQLMSVTLDVATPGQYEFQVGTDWGRGGAAALIDNSDGSILYERVITDDVWWAYDWNNSDVFTTTFDFVLGDSYTLIWVGYEGCCGGSSTIRFSIDGAPYVPLTDPNIIPHVIPEPSTALLLSLGLAGLANGRVRGGGRRKA